MSDDKPNTFVERLEVRDGATGVAIENSRQTTIQIVAHQVEISYPGIEGRVRTVVVQQTKRPDPQTEDFETSWALSRLARARARKESLSLSGQDTTLVDAEIRNLTHVTRNGGQLHPGDCLKGGRYLLVERIGMGGFATVWRGFDNELRIPVAVKVLHSNLGSDPWRVARFRRGARFMRALAHPAVVAVLDGPFTDEGWQVFAMEYVSGGDVLSAARERRLSDKQTIDIIAETAAAVAVAHTSGIVHRDIKPSNILIDENLHPKLCDFDLVSAEDTTGGTRTGALGTFRYTAPEALDRPMDAGPRADVYSLGMTLICGLLREDPNMSYIGDMDPLIESLPCSAQIKGVIQCAVEWHDPSRRFANAGAFVRALLEARSGKWSGWTPAARAVAEQTTSRVRHSAAVLSKPQADLSERTDRPEKCVVVVASMADYEIANSVANYLGSLLSESVRFRVEASTDSLFDVYGRDMTVDELRHTSMIIGIVTKRAVRNGGVMAMLGAGAALGKRIFTVFLPADSSEQLPACLVGLEGISSDGIGAWRDLARFVADEVEIPLTPPSESSEAAMERLAREVRWLKLEE